MAKETPYAVKQIRHIHRRDRSVVAKSRGQEIAIAIVRAILHQRGADAVRGAAVYLPLDDPGLIARPQSSTQAYARIFG